MTRLSIRRALCAAAAVPLIVGVAGCGGSSGSDNNSASSGGTSCSGLLKPADASANPPAGLPLPDGAVFYEVQSQGSTKDYFAHVAGSDFVKLRDDLKAAFEAKGLKVPGTDQEDVEAEMEFTATDGSEGSVQVISLCKDNLRVRYRVG
jgi:hypothetical protein